MRVDLCKGLYRYIESLTGVYLKSWSNVSKHLENAGYKLHNYSREAVHQVPTIQIDAVVSTHTVIKNKIDWGEAIDVSILSGRTDELTKLQRWDEKDKCCLVALLGMDRIDKTALSIQLAQLVQEEFEFVIWRSLRDAPPLSKLLEILIKFLSCQQETNLPETVGSKISQLIEYLHNSRCLLILDNFDVLLSNGQRAGTYRHGYEEYGELLQRLGEIPHQSYLLLTPREKLGSKKSLH
ncbi:NB-ARC domain-containing protein [uncultured Nostoc sp.]|uniref:NB-ARC domain-containing protein n=2 Tax=Nostoc TaxID=1177 RepID=UPI0035CC104B